MNWVNDADAGPLGGPLPEKPQQALARAIRLEWITVGFVLVSLVAVGLVAGQSQAMQAAWAEDALSLLPPVAFLIAARIIRIRPSIDFSASGPVPVATRLPPAVVRSPVSMRICCAEVVPLRRSVVSPLSASAPLLTSVPP